MKISTKGRYALRMLVELAERKNDGFISLSDIARNQDISKNYLEQIIPLLNRRKMLKTTRGAGGGYMLSREPSEYSLGEILRATEGGGITPVACIDECAPGCIRRSTCPAFEVWDGLYKVISAYVDNMTLQDIVDMHGEKLSALQNAARP